MEKIVYKGLELEFPFAISEIHNQWLVEALLESTYEYYQKSLLVNELAEDMAKELWK